MTCRQPTPPDAVLVAIDISKRRNDVLIELTASRTRKRVIVLNTRPEHDRFVDLLSPTRPATKPLAAECDEPAA